MRQAQLLLNSQSMLATLAVGSALWGLWILLWRQPFWPVILAGGVFPLGLWLLRRKGLVSLALPPRFFRLDLWLRFLGLVGARVVTSVGQAAWAALTGSIRPGVVTVPLRVRSEMAQLLLLWAITITPGTIALLAEGDMLYVHCLHLPSDGSLIGLDHLQGLLERIWE